MAYGDHPRPDPEALLRRIQVEEREARHGRLKIFLGYAPRVGKTFRMLDEGRRRGERGQDVVVGAIQAKMDPELEPILRSLEIVPAGRVLTAQRIYDVIDVAALLRRRPQVCLVDELAYDNPPGSRHAYRWQDVEELLEQGITVVTAINLQHIAEQQQAIEGITGKRAAQTVPEQFIRRAEEIVLVDAAPENLRQRETQSAATDPRRLSALRELAMLLAADVVESQLHRYLATHGIEMLPGSQERILVCVTPRSNAPAMLRTARRVADRFHCDLLALYVRQPHLSREDESVVERHLEQARALGAQVHTIDAKDSVPAILEFARGAGVTQLYLGHSMPGRWQEWLRRSPLDRIMRDAQCLDIHIFPHAPAT